jgi:hypothetical protein
MIFLNIGVGSSYGTVNGVQARRLASSLRSSGASCSIVGGGSANHPGRRRGLGLLLPLLSLYVAVHLYQRSANDY